MGKGGSPGDRLAHFWGWARSSPPRKSPHLGRRTLGDLTEADTPSFQKWGIPSRAPGGLSELCPSRPNFPPRVLITPAASLGSGLDPSGEAYYWGMPPVVPAVNVINALQTSGVIVFFF